MRSGTYRAAPSWDATDVRRRGSGLGLALAANLLVLLVLLGLGATQNLPRKPGDALIVDLIPSPEDSAPPQGKTAELSEKARPPVPPVKPHPVKRPLDMLVMTKEEFAAADIRNLSRAADSSGRADGDSEEVGRGPNGEVLYAAEWFRRPTDAELGGYLPRNATEGWGLVACRTIPGHRVEDCVELENYPAGSRLASAVRQAAWQFRVRPPRKNGRELVGAWVRIRIEYLHEPPSAATRLRSNR